MDSRGPRIRSVLRRACAAPTAPTERDKWETGTPDSRLDLLVDRLPAADTAGRPAAAVMADPLVAGLPAAADTAGPPVAVDMADLPPADLRPVVTVDLPLAVDLRATAGLPGMADLRAHRPGCISLRASAVRWAPAAICPR